MKHQASRAAALMLTFLLVTAGPVQAGTVEFAEVVRTLAESRRGSSVDAHLRAIQQQGGTALASGVVSTAQQGKGGADSNTSNSANVPAGGADAATGTGGSTAVILQDSSQQGGTIETVDLGDVTGTVCDCGEIPAEIIKGGLPWWPLLGLGGIPLFFLDDNGKPPNGPPPPTPPPPPIPEPATLMLFGTGLLAIGAGARRRRRNGKTMRVEEDASGEV